MASDPVHQHIPRVILDEAIAWSARISYRTPSQADREAHAAWLAASPMHRHAMARIQRGVDSLGEFGAELRQGMEARAASHSRRLVFAGGLAAAACAAGALTFYTLSPRPYVTAKGEQEIITLADGSHVQLNTDTQLSVHFDEDVRRVRLEHGEAMFDVAHDRDRPFIVEAGGQSVQAIGTKFAIRFEPDTFCVLVTEGVVAVAAPRSAAATGPTRLIANQAFVQNGGSGIVRTYGPDAVERRLAWRNRMLEFDGESLLEATREVERYHDVQFVIEDPALNERRVWLYFRADNLSGFIDVLTQNSGEENPLLIERRGRYIHVRHAPRPKRE